METILFFIFSILAIVGGLMTITRKHPLAAAVSLVVTFLAVSGLYALLNAPFVAVMQILVYAGAIMVLVIFFIMLLNLPDEEYQKQKIGKFRMCLGGILGFPLLYIFLKVFSSLELPIVPKEELETGFGTIDSIGMLMFTRYIYPFEIISLLLLVAIVGAVILAKRQLD